MALPLGELTGMISEIAGSGALEEETSFAAGGEGGVAASSTEAVTSRPGSIPQQPAAPAGANPGGARGPSTTSNATAQDTTDYEQRTADEQSRHKTAMQQGRTDAINQRLSGLWDSIKKFRIKLARQSMEAKTICRHRVPDFANIDTVELRRTTHYREDT